MATYIGLTHLTDQGMRNIKETTKRADAVKGAAGKFGVKIKEIFWTLGKYDIVIVSEAADETSATAFILSIGSLGNTRTQTMRAFSSDEMNAILGKMA
jgi:uncharacterized protein with GYD domain